MLLHSNLLCEESHTIVVTMILVLKEQQLFTAIDFLILFPRLLSDSLKKSLISLMGFNFEPLIQSCHRFELRCEELLLVQTFS